MAITGWMPYNRAMANLGDLSAAGGAGTQTITQSPQSSTQTSSLGQSQNVQNGTAESVLNSKVGVPLGGTHVNSIQLANASVSTAPPTAPAHHRSPVLLGFSGLLFVVAIVLFATATRNDSVKKTTK